MPWHLSDGKWRLFPVTSGAWASAANSTNIASEGSGRSSPNGAAVKKCPVPAHSSNSSSTLRRSNPNFGRRSTARYSAMTRSSNTMFNSPVKIRSKMRPGGWNGDSSADTKTLVSSTMFIRSALNALGESRHQYRPSPCEPGQLRRPVCASSRLPVARGRAARQAAALLRLLLRLQSSTRMGARWT